MQSIKPGLFEYQMESLFQHHTYAKGTGILVKDSVFLIVLINQEEASSVQIIVVFQFNLALIALKVINCYQTKFVASILVVLVFLAIFSNYRLFV